ncbi:13120_t:CDS:2, partial [Racocetra fulgida]
DSENLSQFGSDEDDQLSFNMKDEIESNKEDNEDKTESNKENKEKFETKYKNYNILHNYPKAKDARVFPEHRRLTRVAKCTAVQMLKAGAKPSTIYEAIRDDNGEPIATRRDILNLGSQIYISEENSSIEDDESQRKMGAYSAMKHTIEISESLTKSFNSLDRWLYLHYEELLLQLENESTNINPLLTGDDKNLLKKLNDILSVSETKLSEIKITEKITEKGHPSRTKWLPIAVE